MNSLCTLPEMAVQGVWYTKHTLCCLWKWFLQLKSQNLAWIYKVCNEWNKEQYTIPDLGDCFIWDLVEVRAPGLQRSWHCPTSGASWSCEKSWGWCQGSLLASENWACSGSDPLGRVQHTTASSFPQCMGTACLYSSGGSPIVPAPQVVLCREPRCAACTSWFTSVTVTLTSTWVLMFPS